MSSQKGPTNEYLHRLAEKSVEYFRKHDVPEEFRDIQDINFKTADLAKTFEFLEARPDFQQKVADLVDYSPNRWLLAQEIPVVCARRDIHEPGVKHDSDTSDPYEWARQNTLQGICFSGGGIRSATFNLGVLQGLAKLGILNHFDYLSSVSGGGYIHEWFAAWIKREEFARGNPPPNPGEGFKEVQRRLVPLPSDKDNPMHPEPIRWLRRYSNYLTPQKGLLTADTWVAIAIWLRNTFLNQLILVSGLFVLLQIPYWVARYLTPSSVTCTRSVRVPLALFLLAGTVMAVALYLEHSRIRYRDEHPDTKPGKEPPGLGSESTIQFLVILPLLVACLLHLPAVLSLPDTPTPSVILEPEVIWVFALLALLIAALAWAGGAVRAYMIIHELKREHEQKKDEQKEKPKFWPGVYRILRICVNGGLVLVIGSAVVSAAMGTLAFLGVRWVMAWHLPAWLAEALCNPPAWDFQLTFGPPLLLAVPFLTIVIGAGLVGRDFPDWLREWIARVRAWSLLYGFGWAAFFAIALLGPYFLNWQATEYLQLSKTIKWSAVIVWIFTTAGSVFAGNSNKTSGDAKDSASRNLGLELLAKLGPYVFVLGLLLLLSYAVRCAFTYADGMSIREVLLILTVLPLAIFAVFGWRVDVNEFSMNAFYRNRLTRCYLGASNKKRDPNPLTGFDDRDTRGMQISRLSPILPRRTDNIKYTGPLPIICTTINLTFGEDLAWQERKAASFAFTPLYSGYHVSWTASKPGLVTAKQLRRQLSFNGFVPTAEYAFPDGGINIATAVSISGAAASPNWGYHTDPATAFLMTMFNVRLGWWLFNPRRSELAGTSLSAPTEDQSGRAKWSSPRFSPLALVRELFGAADDTSRYVYLSDGGHFDNMGLYELVRRRCYRIVICDSEQDENYHFEGIANAIRKCRIDFGAEITLDLGNLRPAKTTGNCKLHWAAGTIRYPETPCNPKDSEQCEYGSVLYIKSSLTGAKKYERKNADPREIDLPCEPVDIVNYKFTHPHFPHDTTANQWFTESQFESYRRLGDHVINEIDLCDQWADF